MAVSVELHNTGDPAVGREVQALVEHALSDRAGDWRVPALELLRGLFACPHVLLNLGSRRGVPGQELGLCGFLRCLDGYFGTVGGRHAEASSARASITYKFLYITLSSLRFCHQRDGL